MKLKKTTVNGNEYIEYQKKDGSWTFEFYAAAKSFFKNQGEFYETVLNISCEDAKLAKWGVNETYFDKDSVGWRKMITDGGKIIKTVEERDLDFLEMFNK